MGKPRKEFMNIDDLTIGEAKRLTHLFGGAGNLEQHPATGKYCLIRTYSAGVHVGVLRSAIGREVTLIDSRRIWSWAGALSCSEIASKGITSGKIGTMLPEIYLTEAIEIIPMSLEAEKCLRNM